MEQLKSLRHELHRLAELSGKEEKTAQKVQSFLETTDPDELLTSIGGTGILARYGPSEGTSIMLRCELDALPIPEQNEMDYISANPETGHKCGHDGHMAILCGVAQRLAAAKPKKGPVYLLFQPAEETGKGAKCVLDDERFQGQSFDYVFALHNLPGFKKGQVVVRKGTFAAASVGCRIFMKGKSSHAAHPEEGKSPALAVAQLIQHLSALPQFKVTLDRPAKVTVVHARLGERAFGTSPGFAEVMTTLRTYDDELLDNLKSEVKRVAETLTAVHELDVTLDWVEPFPATTNNTEAVKIITRAAQKAELEWLEKESPFGWSEDFGHFTHHYKGALFGLGSGLKQAPLHAPDYDFPDDLIPAGISIFEQIIEQIY